MLLASPKAYGLAEFQQTILTTVPAAVNVTAINTALAQGTIDPETGMSTSPSASFRLQTNGADTNYDYVLTAVLNTSDSGNVNAYYQSGRTVYLLLGNVAASNIPSASAVNNIKGGSPVLAQNANVIAYPVTNTLTNLSSATATNIATFAGLCYIIKTGASKDGTIQQTIGATPLANTYSVTTDRAGTYQAVLTFTANRKP